MFMKQAEQICNAASREQLGWHGAGFAKCAANDVDLAISLIRTAVEKTNIEFRSFLRKVLVNQPDDAANVIMMDGSLAASDGEGYLFCPTF